VDGARDARTGHLVKRTADAAYHIEADATVPIVKASRVHTEQDLHLNEQRIIFPYRPLGDRYEIVPEEELRALYPGTHDYLSAMRERLDKRDKGRSNPVAWYAYGRTQGLATNFGPKLLTSGINLWGRFVLSRQPDATFYGGYCVQSAYDLRILAKILNSPILDYYIHRTSRIYRGGYRSFTRNSLQRFCVPTLSPDAEAFVLRVDTVSELVEFLLHEYGFAPSAPRDLREFLNASDKMRGPAAVYDAASPAVVSTEPARLRQASASVLGELTRGSRSPVAP